MRLIGTPSSHNNIARAISGLLSKNHSMCLLRTLQKNCKNEAKPEYVSLITLRISNETAACHPERSEGSRITPSFFAFGSE
jgi:hypothetical protein